MARPVVTRVLSAPAFNPQAAPVNTYAGTSAGNELSQLASALSGASPRLATLAQTLSEREQVSDKQKGQTLASELQASGVSYAQAIKDGKIPPSGSPWFHAGLQEQYGRLTADRYTSDLLAAVQTGIRDGSITSLDDYDRIVASSRDAWMKENVGQKDRTDFFDAGFVRNADEQTSALRRQVAQQVDSKMQQTQIDQHFEEVQAALAEVAINRPDATPEMIAGALDVMARNALQINPLAGKAINKATIDAITTYARQTRDVKVLDVLRHVSGGPGSKLARTQYGSVQILKAEEDIASMKQAELRVQAEERTQRSGQIAADFTKAIFDNPHMTDAELQPFYDQMREANPWAVDDLKGIRTRFGEQESPEDFAVKRDLFGRVWAGSTDASEVLRAHSSGSINNTTLSNLMNILGSAERRETTQGIVKERYLTIAMDHIKQDMWDWLNLSEDRTIRTSRAQEEMQARYIDWRLGAGAGADEKTIQAWVSKERETVMDKWATTEVNNTRRRATPNPDSRGASNPASSNTDPAAGLTSGGETYRTMLHELPEYIEGRQKRLSASTYDLLRRSNIDATNISAVSAFLVSQRALRAQADSLEDGDAAINP